jgi:hypothetical protein
MERRAERVAQIVREFMEGFVLSSEIGAKLAASELDFTDVDHLVSLNEGSTLFRLKEECHALFRVNDAHPHTDVQAEELFDLAVGALYHESMKFREGYYTTATYAPRLERLIAEGSAAGPLAAVFWQAFEAGRRRMLESEAETEDLFRETRDQLLIVLRHMPESGAVARSLLDDPQRTERVFETSLSALLEDVYGSAERGLELAVQSLLDNGHFAEAQSLLERPEALESRICRAAEPFARGMASYYAENAPGALEQLEKWVVEGNRSALWSQRAHRVLCNFAEAEEGADPELAKRARALAESLCPPS